MLVIKKGRSAASMTTKRDTTSGQRKRNVPCNCANNNITVSTSNIATATTNSKITTTAGNICSVYRCSNK